MAEPAGDITRALDVGAAGVSPGLLNPSARCKTFSYRTPVYMALIPGSVRQFDVAQKQVIMIARYELCLSDVIGSR